MIDVRGRTSTHFRPQTYAAHRLAKVVSRRTSQSLTYCTQPVEADVTGTLFEGSTTLLVLFRTTSSEDWYELSIALMILAEVDRILLNGTILFRFQAIFAEAFLLAL